MRTRAIPLCIQLYAHNPHHTLIDSHTSERLFVITITVGGYSGGNPESASFQQMVVRWFQFGTRTSNLI